DRARRVRNEASSARREQWPPLARDRSKLGRAVEIRVSAADAEARRLVAAAAARFDFEELAAIEARADFRERDSVERRVHAASRRGCRCLRSCARTCRALR